jgi:hypothetical protein
MLDSSPPPSSPTTGPKFKYITIYHVENGTRYYLNYTLHFNSTLEFFTSSVTKGVFRFLLDDDVLQVYVNHFGVGSWMGIKFEPRQKKFSPRKSCIDDSSCVHLANQIHTDNYITVFAGFDSSGFLNVLMSLKFARGKNLRQVTSIVDIQARKTNPSYSWIIEETTFEDSRTPTSIPPLLFLLPFLLLL